MKTKDDIILLWQKETQIGWIYSAVLLSECGTVTKKLCNLVMVLSIFWSTSQRREVPPKPDVVREEERWLLPPLLRYPVGRPPPYPPPNHPVLPYPPPYALLGERGRAREIQESTGMTDSVSALIISVQRHKSLVKRTISNVSDFLHAKSTKVKDKLYT